MFSVHVSDRAVARMVQTLRSGYIGDGPVVREFEGKVMAATAAPYAVAVNSGTAALHLALDILDVGPGDEVITTAQTFVATSHVILQRGAIPVYADVEFLSGNLDPDDVERRVTEKTRAIMPVHWAGYPCDMDRLAAIAGAHSLPIIEDAAQALGATYKGRPIGSLSDVTCLSFQSIKQITTVDGGMLCLRDGELAERARRRRWFGIDRLRRKPTLLGEPEWDITEIGYKYHMNDVSASLGTEMMDELPAIMRRLREIDARYRAELAGVDGLTLFAAHEDRETAGWCFGIHVERREDFARAVQSRGVDASVVHLRIDHNTVFGPVRDDLPVLARFNESVMYLPLHYGLSDADVERVIEAVRLGW